MKERNTRDNFICKIYSQYGERLEVREEVVKVIQEALEAHNFSAPFWENASEPEMNDPLVKRIALEHFG